MRTSEYEIIFHYRDEEAAGERIAEKLELVMAIDAMRAVRRLVKNLQAEYADITLKSLRIVSVTPRQ